MPAETTGTPITQTPGGTINIGSGWASTSIPGSAVLNLIAPLRGGPLPPSTPVEKIETTTRTNPDGSTTTTRTMSYPGGYEYTSTTTTRKDLFGATFTTTTITDSDGTTTRMTLPDGSHVVTDRDGKTTSYDPDPPETTQPAPPGAPKEAQAPPQPTDTPELPGLDDIIMNAPPVIS